MVRLSENFTRELSQRGEHGLALGRELCEESQEIRAASSKLIVKLRTERANRRLESEPIMRDLTPDIRKEICCALQLTGANSRLQTIVKSWGGATCDMEVLATLQDWNGRFRTAPTESEG